MKALIYIMMLASPFALSAEDTEQNKRKKMNGISKLMKG
jgi:hypothetical protein